MANTLSLQKLEFPTWKGLETTSSLSLPRGARSLTHAHRAQPLDQSRSLLQSLAVQVRRHGETGAGPPHLGTKVGGGCPESHGFMAVFRPFWDHSDHHDHHDHPPGNLSWSLHRGVAPRQRPASDGASAFRRVPHRVPHCMRAGFNKFEHKACSMPFVPKSPRLKVVFMFLRLRFKIKIRQDGSGVGFRLDMG